MRDDRENDHADSDEDQGAGDGTLEENAHRAVGDLQRAAEFGFKLRTEHQTEHGGSHGEVAAAHHIAEQAEDQSDDHVEKVVVERVRADERENDEHCAEEVDGHAEDLDKDADTKHLQEYHEDRADEQRGKKTINHGGVILEGPG